MVCIPCSVNTSRVKTLNNRQFMSQSASQMLILFVYFAARWEREGRKIGEGWGTWRGDMEGKDMPVGQSCDVFATCQNMCACVFLRQERRQEGETLGTFAKCKVVSGFCTTYFHAFSRGILFLHVRCRHIREVEA